MLVLGPPGHGKSYFAKQAAFSIAGPEDTLNIDCASIKDYATLFGHHHGGEAKGTGQLVNFLRDRQDRRTVVIFDEFEKIKHLDDVCINTRRLFIFIYFLLIELVFSFRVFLVFPHFSPFVFPHVGFCRTPLRMCRLLCPDSRVPAQTCHTPRRHTIGTKQNESTWTALRYSSAGPSPTRATKERISTARARLSAAKRFSCAPLTLAASDSHLDLGCAPYV